MAKDVCAVCRVREVPPDRSVCFSCVPGTPTKPPLRPAEARARAVGNAVYLEHVGHSGDIAVWGMPSNGSAAFVAGEINALLNSLRHELADAARRAGHGVANLVAPVVRPVQEDGDVCRPTLVGGGEEGPTVRVVDRPGRVGGDPAPLPGVPEGGSGNGDFEHFCQRRYVADGCRVKMLPDPLGGSFSVGMTPEQAESLAERIRGLAAVARVERAAKYPALYPEDCK